MDLISGKEIRKMPTISKIRFTNVQYEDGDKRYNDELFLFDGHNGAILLENGGGKTVFVQTAIQAILPHQDIANRKIKDTLQLEGNSAHIAIEWILNENPRHYGLTCVTLFLTKNGLDSYRYVYDYGPGERHAIENVPFVKKDANGNDRPADRYEILDYYQYMSQQYMNAKTFTTIKEYHNYLEEEFKIIPSEWRKIAVINSAEGGVESFFEGCQTTGQLIDRLLIPAVEEGMAGHGAEGFAQTFEKHRTNFKEYKRLRDLIEENKLIKEQIDGFVAVYERLHHKEQEFTKEKQRAKAYYGLVEEQKREVEKELLEFAQAEENWNYRSKELDRKLISYEIALEQEKYHEINEKYHEEEKILEKTKENLREKEKYYYSLKLAGYKNDLQEQKDQKEHFEKELQDLEQKQDIEDLKEQFYINSCELKGYFYEQERELNKNKAQLENQKAQSEKDRNNLEGMLHSLRNKRTDIISEQSAVRERIEQLRDRMTELAGDILDNPENEKVEEELAKWQEKVNKLDQQIIRCKEKIKKLEGESSQKKQLRKTAEEEQRKWEVKTGTLQDEIARIDREQQQLLDSLKEYKPEWSHYDSLYKKQHSILEQLQEKVENLEKERAELLKLERLAYRFVDDYREKDIFTADPLIEELVSKWKNSFSMLQTGTGYIQDAAEMLNKAESELLSAYPLWPATIVVSEGEKDRLAGKLQLSADRLTHPVQVISAHQAAEIVKAEKPIIDIFVLPGHWHEKVRQDTFLVWKETVEKQALARSEERKAKEKEKTRWEGLLQSCRDFFDDYSYEHYQELKEELQKAQENFQNARKRLAELDERLEEIEQEDKNLRQMESTAQIELNALNERIKKGFQYLKKKKEKTKVEEELYHLNKKLQQTEKEVESTERNLKTAEKLLEDLKVRIDDLTRKINHLTDNPLYREVKDFEPVQSAKSLSLLEQERKSLQDKLNEKLQGRREIEIQIEKTAENISYLKSQIDMLRQEADELDENLSFPAHGKEEIERTSQDIRHLKIELKNLQESFNTIKAKQIEQKTVLSKTREKYEEKYPQKPIVLFQAPLRQVKEQLTEEGKTLEKEKNYLEERLKKLDEKKQDIINVYNLLDKKNEAFRYLTFELKPALLSEREVTDFPYNRMKTVQGLIRRLERLQEEVTGEKEKVDKYRQSFTHFCNNEIANVKMKEKALDGIRQKYTYEEIVKWGDLMNRRLQRAIRLAEDNMRNYDQQLEQFITHIHTYLQKLADELRVIPRKTKVKVDEKWKEIYLFSIPGWEEQEGKEALRRHIEWIVMQLEKEHYLDENGQEDMGKVRKALSGWLHPKQLLRVVLNNREMKIKCRKVTNDGKVSGSPISWERSNSWSGGEKWSKNMTLFLGILNYIAEKRQHISANMKRHRTVIVDNPFGKASSDHVLNPVFFVAEQLGFQIIALTAHSEGKFLRDYFPIIYSCRLRQAGDGNKLVMTKEKEIRKAYFRDHDPMSLERLGEYEQLELF
ncbi:MAG: hypothetical protein PWQ96_721 [Clostridia bacterium]|jgi:DNA repair exonuclease SbcCD ATPase subunit|nr:hypothetical protein [Clostridiales bacterium]MDK2985079.1 hypothetical protein [Clostridia bacterium]